MEITKPAYEVTVDVFHHAGLITRRHAYEDIIAASPASSQQELPGGHCRIRR